MHPVDINQLAGPRPAADFYRRFFRPLSDGMPFAPLNATTEETVPDSAQPVGTAIGRRANGP